MDSSSSSSPSRKSNKIRDIVRLQQILKKWKKAASKNNTNTSNSTSCPPPATTSTAASTNKSIKFLKKTLSFSESSVPKGYVAVSVGKELKRFVIPTEYLRHQMFGILLREAEEEFGFQQEGVLRFPCEVELFENIVKMMNMEDKRSMSSPSLLLLHDQYEDLNCLPSSSSSNHNVNDAVVYSTDTTTELHPRPQMCR